MFGIHHVTISVQDFDTSKEFYLKFGFKPFKYFVSDDNDMQIGMFKLGEMILEIFCFKDYEQLPESAKSTNTDLPIIGVKHFALGVDSIEEAKNFCESKKIVDKDITINIGKLGKKYFFIEDPDGTLMEIIERD